MTTPTKIKELKVQPRWAEEGGGGEVGRQGPGAGSRAGLQAGKVTRGRVPAALSLSAVPQAGGTLGTWLLVPPVEVEL